MLGVTFGSKHSYNDWGIWLEDTHINPPLPKRYIVDVPARNGLLDLTPELTPTIRFENRTLTFNFRVKAGDWSTLVSQIYGQIHGRTLDVVSDLDPNWHWRGFVTVDDFASDERTGVIVITVDAYPFKLSNTENSYTVNGNGTITCVVDRMEISPAFELTAPTTVIYGDSSYAIESTATTEKTLSGDIVSFVDGTANPAVDLTVDIEAVQSGSGDPSPENVRPISGWDEVNVNVVGKNWLEPISKSGTTTGYYLEFSKNSTGFHVNEIHLREGVQYRFRTKIASTVSGFTVSVGAGSGAYSKDISMTDTSYVDGIYTVYFTPTATDLNVGDIFSFRAPRYTSSQSYTYNIEWAELSIASQNTDTSYEPYNGQTYTIDLDGTRYGGTLDVTTGVLTVTYGYVDLGTLTWVSETSAVTGMFRTDGNQMPSVPLLGGNLICSQYKGVNKTGYAQLLNGEIAVTNIPSDSFLRIIDVSKTSMTASQFKTAMSGVQLVYELATPQVVQLTAEQVMILKNQNNICADSGEVDVTYLAQDYAGKKFYIPDLELTEGSNTLTIQGTGTTKVTYTNGRL